MAVVAYEGTIKDGEVSLPDDVHFPDGTKVYVIVPDYNIEEVPETKNKINAKPTTAITPTHSEKDK